MFLADENVPPKVVEFLRGKNHKVRYLKEEGLTGISDQELIKSAVSENAALVTFDKHFGNILLYPPQKYCGIIRINIHPPILENVVRAFGEFLEKFDISKLPGSLIILEREGFRVKREK